MFENNEFFRNQKNCQNEPKIEVILPNVNSGIVFGVISLISSAIGFAILFGGYSILNISKEIANRPFANIKRIIFVALIMFSLAAIVFGIIGTLNYFKKEKKRNRKYHRCSIICFRYPIGNNNDCDELYSLLYAVKST